MATSLSPAIDHVRILSNTIRFDLIHREYFLGLPASDKAQLLDIALSFHGARAPYVTIATAPFVLPANVRLYIGSNTIALNKFTDITESLISELRDLLDSGDQDLLSSKYKEGMQSWIRLARSSPLRDLYDQTLITADENAIPSFAKKPISRNLKALGDSKHGLAGSLHIFNYLYSFIPLAPVSLLKVLTRHNQKFGTKLSLDTPSPQLVWSHGPLSDVSDATNRPSGCVELQAEVFFHNALEDEFDDLEKTIRLALLDIKQRLRIGGPLMQNVADIRDAIQNRIIPDINDLSRGVGDEALQVKSLRGAVDQLASHLKILDDTLSLLSTPHIP